MSELRDSRHRKPTGAGNSETARVLSHLSRRDPPPKLPRQSQHPLVFRNSGIGMSIYLFVDPEETSVAGAG